MSAVEILDNREPVLEPAKRRGLALVPRGNSAPAQFATSRSDSSDTKVPLKTWLAVFGSALGAFMAILDIQIVNASLPEIQGAIGAGIDDGASISTSYLVAEIVVIPLTAWLSQAFSVRRYMIVNAALFVAFSLACAFATTLPQMIVLRALQGFTGGVLIPLAFTVVVTSLPKSKQPIGMALFGLSVTFAPAIGPTIGGYLTENYGWEYIFYINLLPGTAMIALLWLSLAKVPMRLRLLREGDWLGILTMAIGLGALQTALEEGNKDDWFGSPFIVRLSVIAAIALPLFVCVELWKKKPLLNLRLLMRRNFGLGTTANFLLGMALYGSVFILPLYLSQMQGYNAEQIGEVMMWYGLPQLLIIPLVPKLMQRIDARLMLGFGAAMFAASAFLNINLSSDYSGPQFIWPNIVRAFGQAILLAPLAGIATAGIEVENVGSASALFNMMRNCRRRHRDRGAADISDQARAVPFECHHQPGLALCRGEPGADRQTHPVFPQSRYRRHCASETRSDRHDRPRRAPPGLFPGLWRYILAARDSARNRSACHRLHEEARTNLGRRGRTLIHLEKPPVASLSGFR